MNSISNIPLVTGFETEKFHYYERTSDRLVFNALRIMAYIPIISLVGIALKLYMQRDEFDKVDSDERQIALETSNLDREVRELQSKQLKSSFDLLKNSHSLLQKLPTNSSEPTPNLETEFKNIQSTSINTATEMRNLANALTEKGEKLAETAEKLSTFKRNYTIRIIAETFGLGLLFLAFDIHATILNQSRAAQ